MIARAVLHMAKGSKIARTSNQWIFQPFGQAAWWYECINIHAYDSQVHDNLWAMGYDPPKGKQQCEYGMASIAKVAYTQRTR